MFQRIVVPVLATMLSLVLLLAALVSPFLLVSLLGLPPCQDENWTYDLTRMAVPPSLLVSSVWMFRLRHRPRIRSFLLGLALPILVIGLNALAARADASRQTACSQRGLQDAIAFCAANPSHYREGTSERGYRTLTLVAPGSTDDAWSCLRHWAMHNGSVSILVDESVYEHYNRTHGRS